MPKLQEKPSALKREHPALQKMKILSFFSIFWVHFCPPGSGSAICMRIRIRIQQLKLMRFHADPDPDTDPDPKPCPHVETLWCKNQENPSDRISHAWAPLIWKERTGTGK
jgi:hypothetical protein